MNEAAIRDHLAANLDLIEPGLRLIKKEYALPNLLGARGFVDIVARDSFGHIVIIEIKRSENSARAALHELHKYVALFQCNEGTAKEELRCILASTTWNELLVPFSEFSRTVDFHAEGYLINLRADGLPQNLTKVRPLPEASELEVCPIHFVALYFTTQRQREATPHIAESFEARGITDYLIIDMEYKGDHQLLMQPFAQWIVMGGIRGERRAAVMEMAEIDESNYGWEMGENPEWWLEEQVLTQAVGDIAEHDDSGEAGDPEKFRGELERFRVVEIRRYGRFAAARDTTMNDERVLSLVSGVAGENPMVFLGFSTPRFQLAWGRFKARAPRCLEENLSWHTGLEWYWSEVERCWSESSVFASIYNPMNIMTVLYKITDTGDLAYRPLMEVVVKDPAGALRTLVGVVVWDRVTCPDDPAAVLLKFYPKFDLFFFAMTMGATVAHEEDLMSLHGLRYALFEFVVEDGRVRIYRIERVSDEHSDFKRELLQTAPSFLDSFVRSNPGYMTRLRQLWDDNVVEFRKLEGTL
jgi:hypothetical protein